MHYIGAMADETPPPHQFDTLSTPVIRTDADGRIVDCNLAFARWLGVGRKRLNGRP